MHVIKILSTLSILASLAVPGFLIADHGGSSFAGGLAGGLLGGAMMGAVTSQGSSRAYRASERAEREAEQARIEAEQLRRERERERVDELRRSMEQREFERSSNHGNTVMYFMLFAIAILFVVAGVLGFMVMRR